MVLSTKFSEPEANQAIYSTYKVANIPCPEVYFAACPKEQQLKLKNEIVKSLKR